MNLMRTFLLVSALASVWIGATASLAHARASSIELIQKTAENQVRNLLEPVLEKYCRDECKLMNISAAVDVSVKDQVQPGYDDVDGQAASLAPSSARIKLLINEKVGPVSRRKLLDLLQQYLDTLDFPVKVDTQLAHFPEPIESAGKIAEIRERITKQFKASIEELFHQFCPNQCLLSDFSLATETVNSEEAQYGKSGEFVQDGNFAIRIREIAGTILVDETLTPQERDNILEMAKFKSNSFKNVNLTARSLAFPRPGRTDEDGNILGADGRALLGANGRPIRSIASSDSRDSKENLNRTTSDKLNASETHKSDSQFRTDSKESRSNSETNQRNESNQKQERFERTEKIERVEQSDAIHQELEKFKVYGLVLACAILSLLVFVAITGFTSKSGQPNLVQRMLKRPSQQSESPSESQAGSEGEDAPAGNARSSRVARNYEIDRLLEELTGIFGQQPKVAKHVFSRVLTEEGVEICSAYIHLFGEAIVLGMLRDPSLQRELSELVEFYAKNVIELDQDEKLELLRKLHNRTVAGKLVVLGNSSSNLFDFLAEMDAIQILELVRTESLTVKAIILTQCDTQKRAAIYAQFDQQVRMAILTELSRIDYLPRDFIFNCSNALKRKRRENPKLNTEALPGSEVLVGLLERAPAEIQRDVVRSLEISSPDSVRTIKSKLVSVETLKYLRDGQMLEVILNLKHEELLQFLKGAPPSIMETVFAKSPRELTAELEDELKAITNINRDVYHGVERKVLNRIKVMAGEGTLNLIEANERMFANNQIQGEKTNSGAPDQQGGASPNIRRASGW